RSICTSSSRHVCCCVDLPLISRCFLEVLTSAARFGFITTRCAHTVRDARTCRSCPVSFVFLAVVVGVELETLGPAIDQRGLALQLARDTEHVAVEPAHELLELE